MRAEGPRGATPRSRSGGAASEEISLIQGKEQQLRSSLEEIPYIQGKRNPRKTVGVARGHQRADTLKS